ncbi:MAG: hypothetical protein R3D70_04645 [Rhizobiaceae bacterium]
MVALASAGRADAALRVFNMLNPVNHALDRESAEHYRVEPYVVAADVYSGDKGGRGGWTWYTGSAGWLYRAAVEAILGLRRENDRMFVEPALPSDWPGFSMKLKLDGAIYHIAVERGSKDQAPIEVDGEPGQARSFNLVTEGEVEVLVRV